MGVDLKEMPGLTVSEACLEQMLLIICIGLVGLVTALSLVTPKTSLAFRTSKLSMNPPFR